MDGIKRSKVSHLNCNCFLTCEKSHVAFNLLSYLTDIIVKVVLTTLACAQLNICASVREERECENRVCGFCT